MSEISKVTEQGASIDLTNKDITIKGYKCHDVDDNIVYDLAIQINIAPKNERSIIGYHLVRFTPNQWEVFARVFEQGNIDFEDFDVTETESFNVGTSYIRRQKQCQK